VVAHRERLDQGADVGRQLAQQVHPARVHQALLGRTALLPGQSDEAELAADVVAPRGALAAHVVGLDGDPVALGDAGDAGSDG
jgi:hypothetical protein